MLVPLALLQPSPTFSPSIPPSEARGVSAGLCATSTAPPVCAHGPGAPQLPHPCLGSLGTWSFEVSLSRANRLWELHPHQALPSASEGCCTSASGCSAMRAPLSPGGHHPCLCPRCPCPCTEFFLSPLVCFHCHGQWQAPGFESYIKSRVNTSPCLFPLGKINK